MIRITVLLPLITCFFVSACSQNNTPATQKNQPVIETITPQLFAEKLKEQNTILLDVRTPGEWKKGYIDGATHLDIFRDDFEAQINKLDKSKTYLVYCAMGGRSLEAAEMMEKKGFVKVYDLDGGLTRWKSENLPTVLPTQ
jgi:phage shock protein E